MTGNQERLRDLAAKLRQQGRLAEAVEACRRALAQEPEDARSWSELAHALRWQEQYEEAWQAAAKAVHLAPGLAEGWFNLGAALVARNEVAQGLEAYRKALELKPDFTEAWSNLGSAYAAAGDKPAEIAAYRRAIEINPRLAPVWSNLGEALSESGSYADAIAACRRALELDPAFAQAWNNLGKALCDHGEGAAAVQACERAVELSPGMAEAWSNLGNALQAMSRFDEAASAHRKAIEIQPAAWKLHFNLGTMYTRWGRPADAIPHYRRALALDARDAGAHWNLALALLGSGHLAEGWEQYEYRWGRLESKPKRYDFATWDGDVSKPQRLLLWAEQGVGDQIIYGSMIADLVRTPLHLTLEVDPRLMSLFRRSFPGLAVVPVRSPPGQDASDYDAQCPLGKVGRWLRPSMDSFPQNGGYLKADAARVEAFSKRLNRTAGQKVIGISWRSANVDFGADKSSQLADWVNLISVPGARFMDLQYGDTEAARQDVRRRCGLDIGHLDEVDLFNDLEGLAALCAACDLVITVSNVTAHMAGALGRPVWLLAPRGQGRLWYWFSGREDSPWYPSMRIFSQQTQGDWRDVLDRVARELAGFIGR